MLRVPKTVGEQRRERLVAEAKRGGKEVSQEALALADGTLLLTDVEARRLSLAEARVLLRERGPMELLYQRWKQDGQVDEWRTKKRWRRMSRGVRQADWFPAAPLVDCPVWLARPAAQPGQTRERRVRATGWCIMEALAGFRSLRSAVRLIERRMRSGSQMNKRHLRSNSAQLLEQGLNWALSTP